MGTTYSNCQVRHGSQDAVADALKPLLKEPAYVSPAVGGWIGVYPDGEAETAVRFRGFMLETRDTPYQV